MRKEVPQLDNSLTNDEFLQLIVDSFQSVVFGTVDQMVIRIPMWLILKSEMAIG